jgi:4-aminobutyrate---pyruvate transaminase
MRAGRVFYTSSGSEANDTMVKMLWFINRISRAIRSARKILTRDGTAITG